MISSNVLLLALLQSGLSPATSLHSPSLTQSSS
uniref:AMP-dependent synthetase and ligase family protein n=1 Tax=Rhizophora mucronata TaxID=61149 RepID=A0A2P2N4Q2_RHIMU